MTEIVNIPSDPALYDYVLNGFIEEAKLLAKIAKSDKFSQYTENYSDFRKFIAGEAPKMFANVLKERINDENIIDANHPDLIEFYNYVNLAASCAVFQDWKLPTDKLSEDQLVALVKQSVPAFHQNDQIKATLLSDKLNGADTIRIVTMLRLLGLLPDEIHNAHQLSLGSARGIRDLHSVHLVPGIEHSHPSAILKSPEPETISFNTSLRKPTDVVIVDNHPAYRPYYESLSSQWDNKVVGVHTGSYEVLENFLTDERTRNVKPRDLIFAFRIDHRGFPDVVQFLRLLGPVIADTAHFVITMGAGHSIDEFTGRVNTMKTFNVELSKLGMQPYHFTWHKGEALQEKYQTPLFGLGAYTSYETLYCNLDKKRLLKL